MEHKKTLKDLFESRKNELSEKLSTLSLPKDADIEAEAKKYLSDEVKTTQEAIQGAKDIIAENVSDNANLRWKFKDLVVKAGSITSKLKKDAVDEKRVYEMYYDYTEKISNIADHRVMALDRAEKEKIITVSMNYDLDHLKDLAHEFYIKDSNSNLEDIVKEAIERMLTIMGGGKYSYNGMNIEVPQTKNNTQNCFDSIVTLLNMKSVSNITETQLKEWTVENENLLHGNMAYSMKTLYDKFKTVPNPIWQYAIPVWEIGIFCIYLATQKIDIRNVTKKDISSLYPQYQEFVGNNIETGIQSFYVLCA